MYCFKYIYYDFKIQIFTTQSDHINLYKYCHSGDIEDETHFMLHCSKFQDQRYKLKSFILNTLNKTSINDNQFLNLCLNSNSLKIMKMASSYISNCFKLRNNN